MDARDDDPRTLLGGLLRQARTDAGLTQDAVGHAIGVERSGVTRMEAGDRALTVATLGAWIDKCGVSGLAEAGIRGMWRAARRHGGDDEPVKVWFVGWVDAEGKAHMLRYWSPLLVPGILQTADYAYEVFRVRYDHDGATKLVTARMERQAILGREIAPTIVIVLWEPVLYHQIGTPRVMHDQLARLLEVAQRPGMLVHVVPSELGANIGLGGPVSIASVNGQPDVLLTSSLLEDVVTTDLAQVRQASTTFETVRGVAANIMETRRAITEAIKFWDRK